MGYRSFALGTIAGSMGHTTGGYYGGTMCSPTDDTFFCKLDRFTSEIHMLLFLVSLIVLPIYLFVKYKKNKK